MKQPVIYKIINTINNKFYVGSTTNQYERFRTHRNKLRVGKHHCAHLQAAWNKYGEAAFVFHVIEVIEHAELLQAAEDKWLSEWVGHETCYNHGLLSGAPWRGVKKEDHPSYGKSRSEETKKLLRTARLRQIDPRLGTRHTEETKQRIRDKKLANPTRAWAGKTRDADTRAKISNTQKGVKKGPRVYTAEGLVRAQENMRRNAKIQAPNNFINVLAKFPQAIQDKYDFTNAIYTGALSRIEGCGCPIHGIFSQYAAQFRKGRGCPSCGADQRAKSKQAQMKAAWSDPEERAKMMAARK